MMKGFIFGGSSYYCKIRAVHALHHAEVWPIIVPGHYNTTPEIEQDMDKFKELATIRALHTEVKVLQPGESFTF